MGAFSLREASRIDPASRALTTNRGGLQTQLEHKAQCRSSSLQDRGIVEIAGADATKFLHNLVTNDIANSPRAKPAFARCWRRRGEILGDFLFFTEREGESRRYLLDCPSSLEPDLLRRLGMYKLRAAVSVTSKSDKLAAFPFSARRNRKFPRWR